MTSLLQDCTRLAALLLITMGRAESHDPPRLS